MHSILKADHLFATVLFLVLCILKESCLGSPTNEAIPSVETETKKSVIIIGGGISGLSAAAQLVKNGGFEVTLLEADDHVGGRVKSRKLGDHYLEFGAEWVHGVIGNRVFEIMNSSGVLLNKGRFKSVDNLVFATQHGEILDYAVKERWNEIQEAISESRHLSTQSTHRNNDGKKFESLGEYASNIYKAMNKEQPIHQRKSIQTAGLDLMHRFMSSDDSSDFWFLTSHSNQGEQFVYCEGNYGVKWIPPATYTTFIGVILGQEIKVRETSQLVLPKWIQLDKEVIEVKYSTSQQDNDKVNVKCKDGSSYQADHVLTTVSLGVLKERHAKLFDPDLPSSKQLTIDSLGFGTVNKIYLEFSTPWWRQTENDNLEFWSALFLWENKGNMPINGNYFANTSREGLLQEIDGLPLWTRSIAGFNSIDSLSHPKVLQGWITGVSSRFMETLDMEYVSDTCTKLLRRFLIKQYPNILKPIRSARSTWFANPFTRGSYSFRTVKSEENDVWARDLAAPVFNLDKKPILTFAGEATESKYFSTVHGAYDSGVREANRLIEFYAMESGSPKLIQHIIMLRVFIALIICATIT